MRTIISFILLILTVGCGDNIIHTDPVIIENGNSSEEEELMDAEDIEDFEKYYKPLEFSEMNMLSNKSKWSWFRSAQSEHFFVFWEEGFGSDPNSEFLEADMRVNIDDLLEKAELFYKTNVEKLKFAEVNQEMSYLDKYKLQIYLIYQKEWLATGSGYDDVIGAIWINPSTCQPVGSTIAHELGHSFQNQVYCDKLFQGGVDDLKSGFRYGYGNGNGFWEQCANWQAYQDYPEEAFESNLSVWLDNCHRHFSHEWMRYASYWLLYYCADKHGLDAIARIWKEAAYPEDPIMAYTRLFTSNDWEKMKDELYDYASKIATFDIPTFSQYYEDYLDIYKTILYKTDDDYYQVAYSSCPGSTGFNVINLNVPEEGNMVYVDFEGLEGGTNLAEEDPGEYIEKESVVGSVRNYNNVSVGNEGWRYGFVALKDDGTRVYGNISKEDKAQVSFEVPDNTISLYFIVLGAPKEYNIMYWDEKELSDEQHPYRVRFTGTDIKGNIDIDQEAKPENIELNYDLHFYPSATDYASATVNISTDKNIEEICKSFVIQPTVFNEKLLQPKEVPSEGNIAFAAKYANGFLDYNTTANGHGFWFDGAGNVTNWDPNNDSKISVEYNPDSYTFTIGQFPGKLKSGDKYKVIISFVYKINEKLYNADIVFNITID